MTYAQMEEKMNEVFRECWSLREAGQKEYAHEQGNVFANFEEDARELGIDRKTVLSIFANKHWRGIRAFLGGHRSQREDVRGRINDTIVYLVLLRGMIDQEQGLVASNFPNPAGSVSGLQRSGADQEGVAGRIPPAPGFSSDPADRV